MTLDRAEEIITELQKTILSLANLYHRGAMESNLKEESQEFRYILVRRTPRAQIKVIYFIDHLTKTVFVTDFFPTEKNDKRLGKRNQS